MPIVYVVHEIALVPSGARSYCQLQSITMKENLSMHLLRELINTEGPTVFPGAFQSFYR